MLESKHNDGKVVPEMCQSIKIIYLKFQKYIYFFQFLIAHHACDMIIKRNCFKLALI